MFKVWGLGLKVWIYIHSEFRFSTGSGEVSWLLRSSGQPPFSLFKRHPQCQVQLVEVRGHLNYEGDPNLVELGTTTTTAVGTVSGECPGRALFISASPMQQNLKGRACASAQVTCPKLEAGLVLPAW